MTNERIDHAAEARDMLDGKNYYGSASEALAHATLALVEQQRIANLIALAEHAHKRFGNFAGEAGGMGTLFAYGETEASNMQIRVGIREALGL